MEIKIRKATNNDIDEFRLLCQQVYEESYTSDLLGIPKSFFSKEIFNTPDTKEYFVSLLTQSPDNTSYIAEYGGSVVGGVTVTKRELAYEVRGFYIAQEYQGHGIGRKLWQQAELIIDGHPVFLEVYAHIVRTINMYFRRGFEIDIDNPLIMKHWPEWPEDKSVLMYRMARNMAHKRKQTELVPEPSKAKPEVAAKAKLYTDGGSRGNPGPSAGGYVILDMENNVVKSNGKYLGITTNNQAEYHSLKGGVEMAIQLGIQELDVYMDSLLVINQMKGIFKIRNRDLWPIHDAIKTLLPRFKKVTFTHVPRELNELADAMVNETLDAQNS